MTDPNGQKDKPAQDAEPVVSKPYIMPDDPEPNSVEALTKEIAESRDRMLRTSPRYAAICATVSNNLAAAMAAAPPGAAEIK